MISERFIRILKGKNHKKGQLINRKSYLGYLNKLIDEYNNTYHRCIGKNLLMLIILF